MPRRRRLFRDAFKSKVPLNAAQGFKTFAEIDKQYQIHPYQVASQKKQRLDRADPVFEGSSLKPEKSDEPSSAELYQQIGRG